MMPPTSNASDAFSVALRLLSRCDRSEAQLRARLRERGFTAEAISAAIERCHHYHYLDDQRYALARTRTLVRSGKGVGGRILQDLRQRGIEEDVARHALDQVADEFNLEVVFQQELSRRFPAFCYMEASTKERRRVVSYFQRRGFAVEDIFTWLKQTSLSDR